MTPTAPLSTQRQRQLRALGHHLNPIILVGDSGVSEGVVTETTRALEDHELIKIRTPAGDREGRGALIEALCQATGAACVQKIGRVALLYRAAEKPNPKTSNLLRFAHLTR